MEQRDQVLSPLTPTESYYVKLSYKKSETGEDISFSIRNCKNNVSRQEMQELLNSLCLHAVFEDFQYATPVSATFKKSTTQLMSQYDA